MMGVEDFEPEALEERGQTDFIEKVKCLHAQAQGQLAGVLQAGGEGLAPASFTDGTKSGGVLLCLCYLLPEKTMALPQNGIWRQSGHTVPRLR